MSGLLAPTAGRVLLDDSEVTGPPEEMALVFQEYSRSLMPWLSLRDNVELPLRHKKLAKPERARLFEEAVEGLVLGRVLGVAGEGPAQAEPQGEGEPGGPGAAAMGRGGEARGHGHSSPSACLGRVRSRARSAIVPCSSCRRESSASCCSESVL